MKKHNINLTEAEIVEINRRGYTLGEALGEGHTRIAVKAQGERGAIKRSYVVKIPLLEVDPSSVQAQLAHQKRDWGLEEVLATNQLVHPNIIRPVDAFSLPGRGTVVVEDFMEGVRDVESLMKWSGPLNGSARLKPLLKGVADGLLYLHDKGLVHRDLKPSNILVGRSEEEVFISDLQTANHVSKIQSSIAPTRGGTAYTHPRLLNALLQKIPAHADNHTDVYSLGATTYALLTGEQPFTWKLNRASDGTIVLQDGDVSVESISFDEHERRLQALEATMKEKGISKPWRRLVTRSMTLGSEDAPFYGVRAYKFALEDIGGFVIEPFRDQLKRAAKTGALVGTAAAVLGASIWTLASLESVFTPDKLPARSPSLIERMPDPIPIYPDHSGFGEEATPSLMDAQRELAQYYGQLSDQLLTDFSDRAKDSRVMICAKQVDRVNPRVLIPLLYSIEAHPEAASEYKKNGQDRIDACLVPYSYLVNFSKSLGFNGKDRESYNFIGKQDGHIESLKYLKDQIIDGRSVVDVYAHYFCTDEDIARAQITSRSVHYFPMHDEQGNILQEGYGAALPQFQRDLINTASSVYQITNDKGKTLPNQLKLLRQQLSRNSEEQPETNR